MGDGADDCGGGWLSAGSSRSPQNSFLQVQRLPSGITVIGHCLGFKGNRESEAKEIFFSPTAASPDLFGREPYALNRCLCPITDENDQ